MKQLKNIAKNISNLKIIIHQKNLTKNIQKKQEKFCIIKIIKMMKIMINFYQLLKNLVFKILKIFKNM